MTLSAVCPQEIRTELRQKANKGIWGRARWRNARKAFLKIHKECEVCGSTDRLTPHHPDHSTYGTDAYYDLTDCICLCQSHHLQMENGKVICPVCKKHLMRPVFEKCWYCLTDDERAAIESNSAKERLRELKRRIGQKNYRKAKQWKKEHPRQRGAR